MVETENKRHRVLDCNSIYNTYWGMAKLVNGQFKFENINIYLSWKKVQEMNKSKINA